MRQKISRRKTLKILTAAPVAASFSWTKAEVHRAHARVVQARSGRGAGSDAPQFFKPHEYETVQVLVDLIIPADDRSGSATEAGVHQFIDFMMIDRPDGQTAMQGGLAWLDVECEQRFGQLFVSCSQEQQKMVLDDIAWPDTANPEFSHGVAFFNSFRDLTATGFWTTKMGIEDLRYIGNVFVPEWKGCPEEALKKLGVEYDG